MWSRRNSSRSPTGSATRWSPTCAAPSPATPTPFRRRRRHGARRRRLDIDRPDFIGHVDGRLDVTRDTRLLGQARLRVATDNPGSPNVQAGLARYPVYTTFGGTLRRRPELQPAAGFRRRHGRPHRSINNSKLTDGTSTSNDDRNYNQYRRPRPRQLRPDAGPETVRRNRKATSASHDLWLDRNGYQRNSSGGNVKAGTSFEFSRLLTGEIAIGWAARNYEDPRLQPLQGLLTSASLVWTATPLTTAKFFATTSIDETTLPGVSGVLTHTYTVEVDHDFRRWLTAHRQIHLGPLDYQGDDRFDKILFAVGRPDLQDEPHALGQGHAAARLAGFQHPGQQHGVDGGDAGRAIAALKAAYRHFADSCVRLRGAHKQKPRHLAGVLNYHRGNSGHHGQGRR